MLGSLKNQDGYGSRAFRWACSLLNLNSEASTQECVSAGIDRWFLASLTVRGHVALPARFGSECAALELRRHKQSSTGSQAPTQNFFAVWPAARRELELFTICRRSKLL